MIVSFREIVFPVLGMIMRHSQAEACPALKEHPVIEGYCYVPLHAAILVHVFLTLKGALPTTLHELFCSLVLCCIAREHARPEPVSQG